MPEGRVLDALPRAFEKGDDPASVKGEAKIALGAAVHDPEAGADPCASA